MEDSQDKSKLVPRNVGDIDLLDSENSFCENLISFARNKNRWKYTGEGCSTAYLGCYI